MEMGRDGGMKGVRERREHEGEWWVEWRDEGRESEAVRERG